ncbi:zinc finger protein 37-like isoform X2 [Siniperca chuatsi]|uniref:zinc finger protein 37-like isoform X2 n=1 Tax=Siniperca chuatsi TaxID=119488 RepID=UPI001CE1F224|nr:zinc finger protein 37-like isoform X2 [Siniperca chuatsi]
MEDQEHLTEPDYEAASRLLPPTVQSDRRKPGRPRISEPQDHVDLRIRILEDSRIEVLSASVYKKYPLQELQCPRGLQEADFLDLLRSTFPQLAAEKPFDVFTTDRRKRLQPLKVKTLTPEEIYGFTGHSALYIRLKPIESNKASANDVFTFTTNPAPTNHPELVSFTRGELTSADEEFVPSQRNDAAADPPPTPDQNRLLSTRVQSDRRKPGRPRISEPQDHIDLRIRILEDSQTDVLSASVYKKYPLQELQCPRGLQEADFLDLLRSTFPQLAAEKPFDVFTSDRTRRLQPLKVKTLTPEEIYRSIRLTGAGNSALYIRLKGEQTLQTGEDPQTSSQDLHPLQRQDDATKDSPSSSATMSADETQPFTGLLSPRDSSERRRRGRPRLGEEPTHHFLKVCMLEDSQSDVLSKKVLLKSSIQEVRCPRGLQEADFLDLLRSTFPQLAGDNKPLDVFKSDRSRRLQRLKVKTLTPEEIYRSMKSTGVEKTLLYIRLKTGEEEEEKEELHLLQRNHDGTSDSTSTAVVIKSDEAGLSSSPVQHVDVLSSSSTSQQQDKEEADDEDAAESQVDSSDGDDAFDGDDDWKPDPEQQSSKMRRKRGAKTSGVPEKLIANKKTPCKVCGVWYRILGSLIKHAWSHVEEPQCVCGVCGEHFVSVDELKGHLRNYQKTHDCSYCGKSFFTITGLNSHTTLHTGNRPFKCDVCHKTFAHMSTLSVHRWVHVADKPHKCDICPKAFGLKAQLRAHSKVHTGRDKYHCNVCGKSFYDLRSLTRHKTTHSGERRYGCEVCGKRFKLPGTLKSHEKIHTSRDRPYLCHICCKTFLSNCGLTTHMKTHSNERPFICVTCSKGFISNGELKAHMRVHTGEAPYGCSDCGRFFKRKTHLTNHVRSHLGIKLFVCGVCGKACSRQEHLTVHMRTHNGERPYQCTVCDKAFTQSHCLKTHMRSHQGEEDPFLNAPTS